MLSGSMLWTWNMWGQSVIRMKHSVIMDSLSATHFQLKCFFMNAKSGEKGNITLTGVLSMSAIQAELRPFTSKVRNRETASSTVLPSNWLRKWRAISLFLVCRWMQRARVILNSVAVIVRLLALDRASLLRTSHHHRCQNGWRLKVVTIHQLVATSRVSEPLIAQWLKRCWLTQCVGLRMYN